ncbi:MAG: hypothetical protein ACR2MO_07315 [Acidimicrobiales bacterium]
MPPITLTPTDPGATTTTLLPPLVPAENLLPAPAPGTPPSSVLPLPLPTAPPPRRTISYRPPPVPPSTPVRAARSAPKPRSATTSNATPVETAELGEGGPGVEADLPFAAQEAAEFPSGDDTMELGIEASERDQVGSLASVAAGLIAFVLLGIALWLRREVREPAPLPPW